MRAFTTQPDAPLLEGASAVEGDRPVTPAFTLDSLDLGVPAIVGTPRRLTVVVLRLLEMGLTPGTEITVIRRALGADPIEVRIRGTRICLRRADAAEFPVQLVGEGA